MLASIPLLVIPFILYNLGLAGIFGDGPNGDPWQTELFSFRMMSGGMFSMTLGILMKSLMPGASDWHSRRCRAACSR